MTYTNTQIQQTEVMIPTSDGQMPACLFTHPENSCKPAVLLLMAAFGLTSHIRDVAARIASVGDLVGKVFHDQLSVFKSDRRFNHPLGVAILTKL